jgi:hypothetical protein
MLNLRVPPPTLVTKWGRAAGLSTSEIDEFQKRLPLKYKLGKYIFKDILIIYLPKEKLFSVSQDLNPAT